MAPILHGRIHPETYSAGLLRRELRILVDPASVTAETIPRLVDLDILRQYLASLPGLPCTVRVMAPAPQGASSDPTYDIFRRFGGEVLPYGAVVVPDALTILGELGTQYPDPSLRKLLHAL